jgi:hypothetical protein
MSLNKGLAFAAITSLTLMGCGGGGGNSSATGGTQLGGSSTGTMNNPLSKYTGTYYLCRDNRRLTTTLTAVGTDSLSFNLEENVYSGNNCSGSILATYLISNLMATYKSQTTATMPPFTILPYSDKVDEVILTSAGATNQLTGPGVQGNCVKYSYTTPTGQRSGENCYTLTIPNETAIGAIYLTDDTKYMVQFLRQNGVLSAPDVWSRDPSFNYNMLVRD